MGNCSPILANEESSDLNGFYDEILKCPSMHWLALYQTPACKACQSRNILSTAHISCTICDYSLCQNCFSRKFRRWEKSVKSLAVEDAAKLNKMLLEELQKIVEHYFEEYQEEGAQRLKKYLEQQAFEFSKMRASDDPINFEESLEVRVGTLAKLCLKAYESRLPVTI